MGQGESFRPFDPQAVDALLFDFGGVVIEIDFERVFASWARDAGCDPALIRARFTHDVPYERHERGEIDVQTYLAALRASLGIALSDGQFRAGWDAIFVGEMPGMRALLEHAGSRLPLYLFTNSNAAHQQTWAARYADILKPFRRVFVSSELGLRKPEREAFLTVARAMALPPQRIAFFDDSAQNVAGARAVGMQAVQVSSVLEVATSLRVLLADHDAAARA